MRTVPLVDRRRRRRILTALYASAFWASVGMLGVAGDVSTAEAQAATGTIIGRVVDSRTQQPLDLATLEVEGTRVRGGVGNDGRFRLTGVPAGSNSIVARRIGYGAVHHQVTVPAGGEATVDFSLETAAVSLDQIVVTGTAGGEQKREIANAVATIDASTEVEKATTPTITTLLNARAPGLQLVPAGGQLGAVPAIEIRGRNSLSLANNPLVYIDGVRVSSATQLGPNSASGLGTQGASVAGRLNDINPDDIESIEVISGPAAATIYGTEAAAGVVQIITKKGAAGGRTESSGQVSMGSIDFNEADRIPTNYAKDKNGNIIPWNGLQQAADSGKPLYKLGMTRTYNMNTSGGSALGRYYVAGGYENDYGVEPNNLLRQLTGHANVSTPLGAKTDGTLSLNFVDNSTHLGAEQGESALIGAEFGHSLLFGPADYYPGFPVAVPQTLYDNTDATNRFTGSATVNNQLFSWFRQKAVVGLDYVGEDSRALERFAPPNLAVFLPSAYAAGRVGQTLRHNTIITADYSGTAKWNVTSALASNFSVGGQYYNTEQNTSFLGGIGFPAPNVETVSATATALASSQLETINTTIGAYAQEEIGWRDRFFLTGAVRVDNNSAFGDQFKWVTYPKLGASWVVNEEPWFHWSNAVNTLRLRAAYGESGRQPTAFSALRTFTPVTGFNGTNGVTPNTIGNPDLQPEIGKELELGAETGFYNRLTLSVTYYNRHTFNEIVNQSVAPSSGFPGSRVANLGQVNNHGLELQSTFQAITRRNFSWEITGNLSTEADKVISLGGIPSLITQYGPTNVVGYPILGIWSKRVASASRDANGFATNVLCDGGAGKAPVACSSAPFEYLGASTPGMIGGLGNTFNIGPFRLYALLDFKRNYLENLTTEEERCTQIIGAGLCRANYYPNEYSVLYDAETTTAAYLGNYVDQYYQSGAFLKLREVSASYNLPPRLLRGFSRASFTLSARDIHTWSNWRDLDPEAYSASGPTGNDQAVLPPLMRINATVNLAW